MHATTFKAALAAALISCSGISAAAIGADITVDAGRWIDDPVCDLKLWKYQCDRWETPRRCYWPDRLFPFPHPHCWPQSVIA